MAAAATAALAATTAVAAYYDAKYHLRKDLNVLWKNRVNVRRYQKLLQAKRISPWFIFADTAAKYPDHQAIWSRRRCYTFQEAHDEAVRLAQWLLARGIRPGEIIAMYMTNSPEFMIIWLALFAIGCAPAFVNYNLTDKALVHCVNICDSTLCFVDEDEGCRARIDSSRTAIKEKTKVVIFDDAVRQEIASFDTTVPGDEYRTELTPSFPICLCFTSGTTGLPKLTPFNTSRTLMAGGIFRPSFDARPGPGGDRYYNCMPLYHGTGGITAIYASLSGVSLAIGKKFSARNFWHDIHDSDSSMFIYVGEVARYLLAAPPHPLERSHRIRCIYGNGLRADVWTRLQLRFNIPQIAEFFSSSEGMFSRTNWVRGEFLRPYVGHDGAILRYKYHDLHVPVKTDADAPDGLWRDPVTGFGKRESYEVGGEILVKCKGEADFGGYYANPEATRRKFVRDVLERGDLYYRTGDALRRDGDGRWSFLDRLGDTFRWKSENVSTEEVALCLGAFPGVREANVYGVKVPGHEGRAGCAAVLVDERQEEFDWKGLALWTRERLPRYAVPVFVRVVGESRHTHNLKQDKVSLREEGVEWEKVGARGERVLWLRPGNLSLKGDEGYVDFGREDWEGLVAGRARL